MPNKEKLAKLKEMMGLLNDGLTRQEFLDAFKEVLAAFAKAKQEMSRIADGKVEQEIASLDSMKKRFEQAITDAEQANATTFEGVRRRAIESISALFDKMRLQERFDDLTEAYEAKIAALDAKILAVPDAAGLVQETIKLMPPPHEDTAEEERDRLESLEGEERLDATAIKGLEDLEKRIVARIGAGRGMTAPRSNNSMKFADLSSQTTGSLKIFSVPKGLAGVVFCSDFPTVLMEGNGFTLNASRTQLTLTVENAPSAGSQLLYQYMSQFN